ncbi:MAG: hypothetical protein ACK5E6_06315 [Cyanobacteriota bacterium]|jgi:hypothetical protein
MADPRAGSGFDPSLAAGAGPAGPVADNLLLGRGVPNLLASLGMVSAEESTEAFDPVEAYFECITTCSLDDGECITTCAEVLRSSD